MLKELKGSVVLRGQTLPVDVKYNTFTSQEGITIGTDTFQLGSEGISGFDGHRVVKENTRTLADENVSINMDPEALQTIAANPQGVAKEWGFANADEFQFHPGDNALIMRANNLDMSIVANCMRLE